MIRTYIPHKHYASFWKPKLYSAAYGGKDLKFIEFTKTHLMHNILIETVKNKTIPYKP
jgi:hypothetical protein